MTAVLIRQCASLEEALVVHSFLQAQGFHASMRNYYHASLDWGLVPALGGVQIILPEGELEPAEAAMIEAAESSSEVLEAEFGAYEAPAARSRWRAWSMLAIWFYVPVLPLIPLAMLFDAFITLPPAKYVPIAPLFRQRMPAESAEVFGTQVDPSALVFLIVLVLVLIMEFLWAYERRAAKVEASATEPDNAPSD